MAQRRTGPEQEANRTTALHLAHTLTSATSCDGVADTKGWTVAAKVLPDPDGAFLESLAPKGVALRPGRAREDWTTAFAAIEYQLVLLASRDGEVREEAIASARRMHGPIVAGHPPVVAWTELQSDRGWRLMLWDAGQGPRCMEEGPTPLAAPALCTGGDRLVVACETTEDGKPAVGVWSDFGRPIFTAAGRRPVLVPLGPRGALLVVELPDARGTALQTYRYDGKTFSPCGSLPRPADRNTNLKATAHPADGSAWLAWEGCPQWGWDERVGLHRDLYLFTCSPEAETVEPAPGTTRGRVPIDSPAFMDRTMFNCPPIHPLPFFRDGRPGLAFRRFRPVGHKGFAWDVLFTEHDGADWTAPRRLSVNPGPPDMGYAVSTHGESVTAFMPACRHTPVADFEGEPRVGVRAATDFRVDVVSASGTAEEPIAPPPRQCTAYVIPPALPSPAEPPALDSPPPGQELVWGDIHAHDTYSKCMSPNDGDPADMLRHQRDVLGCRVLCLTDHVEYMSTPEFLHVVDSVEAEAGADCVPLYGVEYARPPAHHTNFYAIDRDIFLRLRCILMEERETPATYPRIKKELPAGSVLALRHFHGHGGAPGSPFGTAAPRVVELHDPEFEVAMEALQMRGNMMTEPYPGLPFFPSNFLNAGAHIGLVGGSDHARGFDKSRNRFGLTGFWVPELTPEDVFVALKNRRTTACANGKIAAWATLDGSPAGSELEAEAPVVIDVQVASATPLRRVALLRDGELLPAHEVDTTRTTLHLADADATPGRHWYVVYAEAEPILEGRATVCFTSPFFVDVRSGGGML